MGGPAALTTAANTKTCNTCEPSEPPPEAGAADGGSATPRREGQRQPLEGQRQPLEGQRQPFEQAASTLWRLERLERQHASTEAFRRALDNRFSQARFR